MIMGAFAIPIFFVLFFNRGVSSTIFNLDVAFPWFGQHLSAVVMMINGFTGLWLWTERKQAINIAIGCAIMNIVACIISMGVIIANGNFSLRLELIFAIIFLVRLFTIKDDWENKAVSRTGRD